MATKPKAKRKSSNPELAKVVRDSRTVAFNENRMAGNKQTMENAKAEVGNRYQKIQAAKGTGAMISELAADAAAARKTRASQTAASRSGGGSRSEAVKKSWIKRRANGSGGR